MSFGTRNSCMQTLKITSAATRKKRKRARNKVSIGKCQQLNLWKYYCTNSGRYEVDCIAINTSQQQKWPRFACQHKVWRYAKHSIEHCIIWPCSWFCDCWIQVTELYYKLEDLRLAKTALSVNLLDRVQESCELQGHGNTRTGMITQAKSVKHERKLRYSSGQDFVKYKLFHEIRN